MTALFIMKFGLDRMKTAGGVVLKFPAPYGPVLTKISKCHKMFNFEQITKTSVTLSS